MRTTMIAGTAMLAAFAMAGCKHDDTGQGAAGKAADAQAGGTGGQGMTFSAEVVSVAKDGSTLTLRETADAGAGARERYSIKVSPSAAGDVKSLDPGDQVTVTCDEVSGGMGSGTSGGPAAPAEEQPSATDAAKRAKGAGKTAKETATPDTATAPPETEAPSNGRYQGTGSGIGATMGPVTGAADSAGLESCTRIASATPVKGR